MNKTKSIICFIISIAVVLFLGYVVMFGVGGRHTGSAQNVTQGLDLMGGTSVSYQVDDSKTKSFTATDLEDTRLKLENRVHTFSSEATAYKEGDDRITVDIPGEYDADAVVEELGKPGALYFCTATTDKPTDEQIDNHEYVKVGDNYYKVWLSGNEVADAKGVASKNKDTGKTEYVVNLEFNSKGTTAFGEMTTQYVGQASYIIYNDEILSAPKIQSAITGGQAEINGQKSLKEAEELASNIRIGALKVELKEISHKVQSAQLGSDALSKSIKAGIIGFIIIILFLLIVYRIPGLAAGLALLTYVELMLLALNGFDLTLTLPGIAGIILNIGMAVDANVIIYARIREEIAAGRRTETAIKTGFKKAASAIIDGNITTLIAALVLLWKGSGTVQGFATTLGIGILIQLFTSLVISRIFVWILYYMGFQAPKFYGKEKTRKNINFVEKRKVFFGIAIVCIAIGIGGLIFNSANNGGAFNYSIEFKGGTSTEIQFSENYTMDEFNSNVKPAIEKLLNSTDIQAQKDTNKDGLFTIKTRNFKDNEFEEMKDMLVKDYKAVDDKQNFTNTKISDTVSKEMRSDAVRKGMQQAPHRSLFNALGMTEEEMNKPLVATVLATICMLFYIWIRFKNIHFALAAVMALIHDVLIVIGFYALSRVTVGTTFIACMLTIVGYSINATIVIFDRIRENKAAMKRDDKMIEIVDRSITQTLTRSIYTTLTTFVMVFMIFIMGVSSIREFTLPLMTGMIAGAFSSVFITGSLWYVLKGKKSDK